MSWLCLAMAGLRTGHALAMAPSLYTKTACFGEPVGWEQSDCVLLHVPHVRCSCMLWYVRREKIKAAACLNAKLTGIAATVA